MSSQAIGQRIGVSQLAEVLTFYSVAYNVELCGVCWASARGKCRIACVGGSAFRYSGQLVTRLKTHDDAERTG